MVTGKNRMNEPRTPSLSETLKERVKTLSTLYASCTHPLTVALDTFSLALLPRKEEHAEWQDRGFLPFTPHELAWLVAAREQLQDTLDLGLVLRAKAVLPPQAELGGVLLAPEHCGEPYFHHTGQPVIVVCGHPQPPTGRNPACVLTPEEVTALFEAPAGTGEALCAIRSALPGATLVRVTSEDGSRGDILFTWRDLSVIFCPHGSHEGQHAGTVASLFAEQPPIFITSHTLGQLTPLHDRDKETALTVLRVFPGATLFPA